MWLSCMQADVKSGFANPACKSSKHKLVRVERMRSWMLGLLARFAFNLWLIKLEHKEKKEFCE